jgi:murein L,D-transpeptidase YafK
MSSSPNTLSNLWRRFSNLRITPVQPVKLLALSLLAAVSLPALAADNPPLAPSATADKVLVIKRKRKLYLLEGNRILKVYSVSLGGHPKGAKIQEGDERTPEGVYVLDWHNPNSDYYKSIHISYPNANDAARAKRMGVPPGGDLFIHGQPNNFPISAKATGDWTAGCIAVSDTEMDEIWRAVADGTPIVIQR